MRTFPQTRTPTLSFNQLSLPSTLPSINEAYLAIAMISSFDMDHVVSAEASLKGGVLYKSLDVSEEGTLIAAQRQRESSHMSISS
jgi:hypothetical protein